MGNSKSRRESDTEEKQEPCPGGSTSREPCSVSSALQHTCYMVKVSWREFTEPQWGGKPSEGSHQDSCSRLCKQTSVFHGGL